MAGQQLIYAGQGPVYMGVYDAVLGVLASQYSIGCGNRVLKLGLDRKTEVIKESCSGGRLDLMEYETEKSASIELELQQFDTDMLSMALYGAGVAVTGSTVTGETMPTVAVNEFYHTRHPKISAVTVKDSAGTPATLVLNTDYSIDSADYGRIKILDLDSYVQPLKIDYTYAGRTRVKPFSITGVTRGIIFDGQSTADGTLVRVFLPMISFSPTKDFDFLNDKAASLKLSGKLLMADVTADDPVLGRFGVIDVL
jgi:hypothetical protein